MSATAIERLHAQNPHAVKLAEAVAFAVMIDRALLRTARLELVPEADAGAEADLWYSALVQSRTSDGIVLDPAIVEELRKGMSAERVEEVWQVTGREHADLAPSLRIEEEIAYLSFSKQPTASEQLARKLRSVLAAMVSGERAGIARWATRALAMFPSAVRDLPEAKMIDTGARMRLGQPIDVVPEETLPDWLPWIAPKSLGTVPLAIELREDELEIRTDPATKMLEIPNTNPLVLEVSQEKKTKQITFRHGEVVPPVPVERGELRIRTITGEEYDLRAAGFGPRRIRERILDFSDELERHEELIGRDAEIEHLRSLIADQRYITVMGELGIGKTAFLCHIIRTYRDTTPVFIHFFRGGDFRRESMETASKSLVAQIVLRFGLDERALDMRLTDLFDHLALRPNRPERMLIVLDDVDEARDERREPEVQPISEIVPSSPPEFVTVIASTRNPKQAVGAEVVLGVGGEWSIGEFLTRRLTVNKYWERLGLVSGGNFGAAEILREVEPDYALENMNDVVDFALSHASESEQLDIGLIVVRKEIRHFPYRVPPGRGLVRMISGDQPVPLNDLARAFVLQSTKINIAECHREIVRLVEKSADNRDYYLLYAPTHLIEAGDLVEAKKLILDVAFMAEKIEYFGADAVMADLRKIVSSREPGTLPWRVLETIQAEPELFEDTVGELPALLYSRLLNERIPPEKIIEDLRLPPLPLVPAAPVSASYRVPPCRHEAPVAGSTLIDFPGRSDRTLATWSADGTVRLWRQARRREKTEELWWGAAPAAVTAFAAAGDQAVTADAEGFLNIWNLKTQFRSWRIAAHSRAIDGMLFDGKIIVTWSGSDPIRVWELPDKTLEPPDDLSAHTDAIVGCRLLPNEKMMISVSRNGEVRMWNMTRRIAIGKAQIAASAIEVIDGYEGSVIITTSNRSIVEAMRTPDRNPISVLQVNAEIPTGHELPISGVAASGDTPHVATWSEDQTIRIIDTSSREVVQVLRGHTAAVTACAFSTTRPWIASGGADGTTIVWNFVDGKVVSRLEGHLRAIRTIVLDDETVFTAGDDRTVKMWNAKTGRETADSSMMPDGIVACHAFESKVLEANEFGARLRAPSAETPVAEIQAPHPLLATSPDGQHALVCSSEARTAWITDGSAFKTESIASPSNLAAISACALADDGTFAIGAVVGDVFVRTSRHFVHSGRVSALAFAPGTAFFASASWDGTLGVINYQSPDVSYRIQAHESDILALAASSTTVVTGSAAGTLRVWDLETGRAIKTHRLNKSEVLGCWTDGTSILAWWRDGTFRIIHGDNWVGGAHRATIMGVAVDAARGIAYSCSEDRTIRAWDIDTGLEAGVVYGSAPFRCISVRDGIVKAGDDAGNVWTLTGETLRAEPPQPVPLPPEPPPASNSVRVFISHSARDGRALEVRQAILNELQHDPRYAVLMDDQPLEPGDAWRSRINLWLGSCDAAVVIVSPDALVSAFVSFELSVLSYRRQRDAQFRVIPILVDVTMREIENSALKEIAEWPFIDGTVTAVTGKIVAALDGVVPGNARDQRDPEVR